MSKLMMVLFIMMSSFCRNYHHTNIYWKNKRGGIKIDPHNRTDKIVYHRIIKRLGDES
jgi:hypothetical protein